MDEMSDRPATPPELEDRILPWSQVKVISGLSRTTVWRLQKTGDFPASVQVSRNRIGWWQRGVEASLAAFALGLALFVITLILNLIALTVVRRYREQYE